MIPGGPRKQKQRLSWLSQGERGIPSSDDIQVALNAFSNIRKLIFFEGHVGSNFGFGATISFNELRHGGGSDYIEVSLTEASFRFEPGDPKGWGWADGIRELVLGSQREAEVTTGREQARSSTKGVAARTKAGIEGGMKLGFLSGKGSLEQELTISGSGQKTTANSFTRRHTEVEHSAQMTRPDGMFGLRFSSPENGDLVRFNPHLERMPILHPPDPAVLKEGDVRVIASVQPRGQLRHALRIVDAGGKWARANESRNKQIVSELLLNSALRSPVRLWPIGRRRT